MIRISITIFLFSFKSFSCGPIIGSFCYYLEYSKYNVVLSGEIIYTDSLYSKIKVIDVFEGVESRDTITIWNDSNYVIFQNTSCQETVIMEVSILGQVGDSVIIPLRRIQSSNNGFWIIGDYLLPKRYDPEEAFQYRWLYISNDTVRGWIEYSSQKNISNIPYSEFTNMWSEDKSFCDYYLSLENTLIPDYNIIQNGDYLLLNSKNIIQIEIFDVTGKFLINSQRGYKLKINTSSMSNQMIIAVIKNENHILKIQKIIIQK